MLCYLCFKKFIDNADYIALDSSQADQLDIKSIIEKHFWLQIDDAPLMARATCIECWSILLNFHEFYLGVEAAHTIFEATSSVPLSLKEETIAAPEVTTEVTKEDDALSIEPLCSSPAEHIREMKYEHRKKSLRLSRKAQIPQALKLSKESSQQAEFIVEKFDINGIKKELMERDPIDNNITNDLLIEDGKDDKLLCHDNENNRHRQKRPSQNLTSRQSARGKQNTKEMKRKTKVFNEYLAANFKLSCCICNEPQSDFTKLQTHFHREHQRRGYVLCCSRKFFKRGMLVDHLELHQNPELFKCQRCGQTVSERRSLELHMRTHDEKKRGRIHQCEICSKSFYKQVIFERHKLTHIPEEERTVKCTMCEKFFTTNYTMQQHVKLVHLNKYAKICDVCGKSIRGREALERHMAEHEGKQQTLLQCDICGAGLKTKYGLTRHKKMIHTEENRYPVQCEICMKVSPSAQAHKRHMQYTHSMKRKHQCSLCEKAFKRPQELREHMTTHTGEVLYTCPHCPKTFNSNANMYSHRKKSHRKEWEEQRSQRYQAANRFSSISRLSMAITTAEVQNELMLLPLQEDNLEEIKNINILAA